MDYVTVTSSFLPQNKRRKKCVHFTSYIISNMKCIPWIAFNRPRSSHSISQHFTFLQKESCGVMYFILLTLYCLLPFATSLQCYTDVEAKTLVTCAEEFKTCFTKYNDSKYIPSAFPFGVLHKYQEAAIVARGCSTKDKVFYRECETHSYGDNLEKMCFCSFNNCNPATTMILKYAAKLSNWYNISCLIFIIIGGLLLSNYQCSSSSSSSLLTINVGNVHYVGWNPWPSDTCGRQLPAKTRKSIINCFRQRNIRTTSQLIIHCPSKIFKIYYIYYNQVMTCVQNSNVVYRVMFSIYGIMNSFRYLNKICCKDNAISRFKLYCLPVIQVENVLSLKVREFLITFRQRISSSMIDLQSIFMVDRKNNNKVLPN